MAVRRAILWSFTGNGATFTSSLIISMVAARLLTPAEMGVFAVAIATMAVIQAVMQIGLASFLIRERDLSRDLVGSAIGVSLLQGLGISVVLLLLAPAMGGVQRSAEVTQVILILAAAPIFSSYEAVAAALWSKNLRFHMVARLAMAKAAIQSTLSIYLLAIGFGPDALAIGYVATAALGALVSMYSLRSYRPNLIYWRRIASFGGAWMVMIGVRNINIRLPEFLLGRLASLSAAGYYNRASATADMVNRAGIYPISGVLLPVMTREYQRDGRLDREVLRVSSTLTAVFWPVLAALAILAYPVIYALYGDQWVSTAPILSVLCVAVGIQLLISGSDEAFLLLDKVRTAAKLEIIRTCLAAIILVLAAPYGLMAIATARALETAVAVIPALILLRRFARLSLVDWLSAHARSGILTLASIAPLWLFRTMVEQPQSPFVQLALALPIFLLSYVGALFMTRHPLMHEAARLAQRFAGLASNR